MITDVLVVTDNTHPGCMRESKMLNVYLFMNQTAYMGFSTTTGMALDLSDKYMDWYFKQFMHTLHCTGKPHGPQLSL